MFGILRDFPERFLALLLHVLAEPQRDRDLLGQVVHDVLDQNTDPAVVVVAPVVSLPVISRIQDVEELLNNIRHSLTVRLAEHVHLVNVPRILII